MKLKDTQPHTWHRHHHLQEPLAMRNKIYLGSHPEWGATYLSKHSWDCNWYWGFGYLGNSRCHWHMESLLTAGDTDCPFQITKLTQADWWVVRDLFIQAYALKNAAESYRYGGHQTNEAAPYRVINDKMAQTINKDLETLLERIWGFLEKVCKG